MCLRDFGEVYECWKKAWYALLTWPVVEDRRKAQQSILAPEIAVQF